MNNKYNYHILASPANICIVNVRSFILYNRIIKARIHPFTTTSTVQKANFLEWFRGFADGESSFWIGEVGKLHFKFSFSIGLHKDDLKTLEFIQKTLGMGNIHISSNVASWVVTRQDDLKKIIDIFKLTPLNTVKQLDFLAFYEAFVLYTSNKKSLDLKTKIDLIRSSMNKNRSNFEWPNGEIRSYSITSNWLLGFIEGEGSFTVLKTGNFRLRFNLTQSVKDLALMNEIKNFLNNLAIENNVSIKGRRNFLGAVSLHVSERKNTDWLPAVNLWVENAKFLNIILIPFLDSLSWHSKKRLDFNDFKSIAILKEKGLHFTEEGQEVIKFIISQINSKRLSTYDKSSKDVDSNLMRERLNKLLNEPSNLEFREDGRVFIKSLNRFYSSRDSITVELQDEKGLVLRTFDSLAEVARYFEVDPKTVKYWIQNNKPVPNGDKIGENKFLTILH